MDRDEPGKREAIGRERNPDWYDRVFEEEEKWRQNYTETPYYTTWAVIADRIRRRGVRSVLDIGCGPGQLACLLRDKGLRHYKGVDFSSKRVEWARKVCPEFEFLAADAFDLDFSSGQSYDAVIAAEFLEHVERDLEPQQPPRL